MSYHPIDEACKYIDPEVYELASRRVFMQIVKVHYNGDTSTREYAYYTEDRLSVGDVVRVPIRNTVTKAEVTVVDVPEAEIEAFRDKMRTIPSGSVVEEE